MTISTLEEYESSRRQSVRLYTGQWPSNIATLVWGSNAFVSADPGPIGTLANTTSGIVPEAGDTGFPVIEDRNGAQCYLSRVEVRQLAASSGGSDYGRVFLYDRLFHAGEFDMVSGGTFPLSSQPSYVSRLPGGSYVGTQLWFEVRGSAGGSNTVTVSYTNQNGVTGRSTSRALSFGARYMFQFPLQAGDTGVQRVDSVTTSFGGGGVGACNIFVVRPLWFGFLPASWIISTPNPAAGYDEVEAPLESVGFIPVYETSALCWAYMRSVQSTTNPQLELFAEIAS